MEEFQGLRYEMKRVTTYAGTRREVDVYFYPEEPIHDEFNPGKEVAVGCITLQDHGDTLQIRNVVVRDKFRRQGFATKFYDFARFYAKQLGKKLIRDNYQTADGEQMHKSLVSRKVLDPDTGEFVLERIIMNLNNEQDGTSAALGSIPTTGVCNVVAPGITKRKKKKIKALKVSEADSILSDFNELVKVQIPLLSNEENQWVKALCNEPKLQKKIELVTVKAGELQPTQWRIDIKNINRLAREGIFNGGLVIKRRGEMFIMDGHHRALAAQKAGKETVRVRLIDLDDKPVSITTICRRYSIDKDDLVGAMDTDDRIQYEKQP